MDQLFFFLKDLLYKLFVISAQVIHIAAILLLQLRLSLHTCLQIVDVVALDSLGTSCSFAGCGTSPEFLRRCTWTL